MDYSKVGFKPYKDQILIDPLDEQTGIIYRPGKQEPVRGIVAAVGDHVKDLSVGQRVLFRATSGTPIKISEGDGKEWLIMREFEIQGIIDVRDNAKALEGAVAPN